MFLIGLTGGIAAGKSTVAKIWASQGAIEVDADKLARDAVAPNSAGLEAVVREFGPNARRPDGSMNREFLAEIIFRDPEARNRLEGIIHPRVSELAREQLANVAEDSIVIYNVPLLVEANVSLPFDLVVTVEAPADIRILRLIENRGLTLEAAKARVESQASSAARVARADRVLNSSGSLEQLNEAALSLWDEINALARNKAGAN